MVWKIPKRRQRVIVVIIFQKKKPDWALGAKEGEAPKTPTEENAPEIEAN